MIIKGSSRGGPKQLAKHLLRADTNERVQLLELQSPIPNLAETFRDWQFLSTGTRGSKGLYHANIDPDAKYEMTPEQWMRAVDVLEEALGFQGQPRAVVMHEKHGRQHVHVVWQRTHIDTMTLCPDSWNYRAHEEASLALEREFGHEHVPGKHAKRDREKQPEFPKAEITHDEWQQAERTGIDPRDRKEATTELYRHCDNGQAFKVALEEQGYILAKGDRRDFVIVDAFGKVLSLGREVLGIKAPELRAFMTDVDRDALPSADEAAALQKEYARQQEEERARAQEQQQKQKQNNNELMIADNPAPLSVEEIAALEKTLSERHAEDARKWNELHEAQQKQERFVHDTEIREKLRHFDALQEAERDRFAREQAEERKGITGFIDAVERRLSPGVGAEREAARRDEWKQLRGRQKQERIDQVTLLKQNRDEELQGLQERQEQKLRENAYNYEGDRKRYLSNPDSARALIAEHAARRLEQEQRQREEEERRARDGPSRAR